MRVEQLALIALVIVARASASAGEISADRDLNLAYAEIIKDHSRDTTFVADLRKWERAWLNYRDGRATLEAWIAGKTRLDETTLRTTLNRLTAVRVQELKHLTADGSPFDLDLLSQSDDWDSKSLTQYNYYREQVVQRFRNITGPWILAEKAWLSYRAETLQFVQEHGPGSSEKLSGQVSDHLSEVHCQDLNQWAEQLGLTLYRPDTIPENSITDWRDDLTVVSARQDLRVEFTDYERPVAIANADNSRQPLANADPGETNKTTTYSSDVYISPDSRWILQITWRTHGNREPRYSNAFLFEVKQVAPLHLQPYPGGGSFGELAKQHFQVPANSYADIYFVDWKEDKLVFSFTVRPDVEPHDGNDGVDWQCEFDLRKGTFSRPEKLPGSSRFIGSGE
jgi:Lysozyme inhibitor LprI